MFIGRFRISATRARGAFYVAAQLSLLSKSRILPCVGNSRGVALLCGLGLAVDALPRWVPANPQHGTMVMSREECISSLGGQCNDATNCSQGDLNCACAQQGCVSTGCTVIIGTLCIAQNGVCTQATKRCQGVCGQSNDSSPNGCQASISNKEKCVLVQSGAVPPPPDTCAGKCTTNSSCGSFYQQCTNL